MFLLMAAAAGAALPHAIGKKLPGPGSTPSEVIFVLSGGENRILEGFRLWKEGKGKELYILGAGGKAKLQRILPGSMALSPAELRQLHVEGWSENTLENAFSAKGVVSERGFKSVIVVTSDYHVPRAALALRAVLPEDVDIAYLPVPSDWGRISAFPRTLRLFFAEGWKYWIYGFFLLWG